MKRVINSLHSFTKMEAAGGICLILSVALALVFANTSFLQPIYHSLVHSHFSFELLGLNILNKDFHYFVNDALMPIFFFLIGLEVKREIVSGELSNPKNVMLPGLAAVGGLLVPCAIFYYYNQGLPTSTGWAVPAATDIAIAFGVLTLLGNRIPTSLKTFLLLLAIFDDVLVVGIIAVFFTDNIDMMSLLGVAICSIILAIFNKKNVENFAWFAVAGCFLWYFMLKSGIHATIAGILLAAFIPTTQRFEYDEDGNAIKERDSMLKELEHNLHETVSFIILPIFAFVNAGVTVSIADFQQLLEPLSFGIILGLFIGKQLGVFGVSFILIKLKIVKIPESANLMQLYGVAILCGIGFTMGLFIGDLAFVDPATPFKLPILIGSLISALFGLFILHISSKKNV